ncbi:MAG: hypothetical protein QME64_00660 [bacterium]|nr:hypothetical protein [bacterium]
MYYPLKRKNFLDKIKQSPDERRIVDYFYHHRHACETLEDLANDLGMVPEEIESAVHNLEQLGVLHNCGPLWGSPFYASRYTEFYTLSTNEDLETTLAELAQSQILSN